jgi:sn1-specific diacylglycerol lipase
MPAIYLFERRTLFGGDDLQPAAVITLVGRLFQALVLCTPVLHHSVLSHHSHDCDLRWFDSSSRSSGEDSSCGRFNGYCWLITVWIAATLLYCLAGSVLEARIVYWSSQGTPTDVEPRSSRVSKLLEQKLYLFPIVLSFILVAGVAAVSMAPSYFRCKKEEQETHSSTAYYLSETSSSSPFRSVVSQFWVSLRDKWWWLAVALLLLSQITEVIVSWMFLWQLRRLPIDTSRSERQILHGSLSLEDVPSIAHYNHELVEEMWAEQCAASCRCLSSLSCYMFGGRNLASSGPAAFGDVARALADFMESRGVLDVVPSDIVAGLVVLQRLQRQRVYTARQKFLKDLSTTIAPCESGLLDEPEQGNVIVAPALSNRSATIRKRTSNKNLIEQAEALTGSADGSPSGGEDLLMPPDTSIPARGINPQRISHRDLYRINHNGSYRLEERAVLNRTNRTEMFLLHEASRYAKYALAMYSWVLYLYVHPLSGPTRLISKNVCACCCRVLRRRCRRERVASPTATTTYWADENAYIDGDNLCHTHKRAILLTTGLDEADLVYVQLKSSFSDNPYCILLDHDWKSVVVSIRGTFSLEDCVTDVLIRLEPLAQLGEEFGFDAVGQYCHGGVVACAQNVYADLERHGLLDELLLGENAPYPGYTLRFVGHSLGAATSTLLSYMLRAKFPSVRCINYSPPGCTLTWSMATHCSSWCTSCVLDTDLVPRLKLETMERLRDETLELIGRLKVPKIEVARRFVHTSALWGWRLCHEQELDEKESLMDSIKDILNDQDRIPDSEYQRQLARFRTIQEERRLQRGTARSMELYPPGRILHLAKTGERRSCAAGIAKIVTCCMTNAGSEYVPVWVNNDDLNEIVVSATMGTDHTPNRVRDILEAIAEDFGLA